MAGKNEVRVDIVGNDKLSDDIAKVIAQLEALKDKTIEVKINTKVDRNALKKDINDAVDGINRGQGKKALQLKVNRTVFTKSLNDAIGAAKDKINKKGIEIDVDTSKASAKLTALEKSIQGIGDKKVTINIDTDRAIAQLGTLATSIEALDGRKVEVDVRANKSKFADDINDAVRDYNSKDKKNIKVQLGVNKNVFNQEVNRAAKGFNEQIMHKDGVQVHLEVDDSALEKALRDRKINVMVNQAVLRTAINDALGDENRFINVVVNRQVLGDSINNIVNKRQKVTLDVDGGAFERNLNRILQKTYSVRAQVDKDGIRGLFDNETILVRVGVMGLRDSINNIIKVKRRMRVDLDQAEFDRSIQRTLKKTYSVRVRVDKKAIRGLFDNEKITVDVVGNQKALRDSINKVIQTKRRVPIDVDSTAFNNNLNRLLNKTYDVKARVNKNGIKDLFAAEVIHINVVANQRVLRDSINNVLGGAKGVRKWRIGVDADTTDLRDKIKTALGKVIKVQAKITKIDTSKIKGKSINVPVNATTTTSGGQNNKAAEELGDKMRRIIEERLYRHNTMGKNFGRNLISEVSRGMISNRDTGMNLDWLLEGDRKEIEKYIKKVVKGKVDVRVPVALDATVGGVNQNELNRQIRQIIDHANTYIDRDTRRSNRNVMPGDGFLPTRIINNFTRMAGAFSGFMGKFTRSIPVVGAMFRALSGVPKLATKIADGFSKAGASLGAFADLHKAPGLGMIAKMLPMIGKVAGPLGAAVAAIGVAAVGLGALGALGVVGTTAITGGVYAVVGALGALVGISGAVSAAVGAGLIAPFAYFASQLPEVSNAWENLGKSLESEMIDISKATAPGMIKMAQELEKAFHHIKPQLTGMAQMAGDAFAGIADRVPPVANALGDALPKMMSAGIKQLDLFVSRLPNITRSIGDLFAGTESPAFLTATQGFLEKLPGTINGIGSLLQGAANAFNQSMNFLESPQLAPFFEGFRNMKEEFTNTDWSSATEGLKGAMNSLGDFVGNIDAERVSDMIGSLADGFGRLTDLADSADLIGTLDSIAAIFNGIATGLNFMTEYTPLGNLITGLNDFIRLAGEAPGFIKRMLNIDGEGDAASSIEKATEALDRFREKLGEGSAHTGALDSIEDKFNSIGNQSANVGNAFQKMFEGLSTARDSMPDDLFGKYLENTEATVKLVPDVATDELKTGIIDLNVAIKGADRDQLEGLLESQRALIIDVIPRLGSEGAGVNFAEALAKAAKVSVSPEVDEADMNRFRAAFDKVAITAVTTDFSDLAEESLGGAMQIYADILPRLNFAQIESMAQSYEIAMSLAPKLDQKELDSQALHLNEVTASIRVSLETGQLAAAQSQIDAMNLVASVSAKIDSVEAHTNLYDNTTIAIKAIPEIQSFNNEELTGLFNQALTQTVTVIPQIKGLDAQQALLNSLGQVTVDVQAKLQVNDIPGAIGALQGFIANIPTNLLPPTTPPNTEGVPPAEVPTEYGEPTNSPPSGESTGTKATIPVEWGEPTGGPTIPPINPAQIPVHWGTVPPAPVPTIEPAQIPTQWAPVVGLPAVPEIPPAIIPVQWGAVPGLPAIPAIPVQIIPVEWGTPSGAPPSAGGRFMGGSGSYGMGGFTGEASSSGLTNSAGIAGYQGLRNHVIRSIRALESDVQRELDALGRRSSNALGMGMADGLRNQAPAINQGMTNLTEGIQKQAKKLDKNGNRIRYEMEFVPHELGGGMGTWKSKIVREAADTEKAIQEGGSKIGEASSDVSQQFEASGEEIGAAVESATENVAIPLKKFEKVLSGFEPHALGGGMGTWKSTQKFTEEYKKMRDEVNKGNSELSQTSNRQPPTLDVTPNVVGLDKYSQIQAMIDSQLSGLNGGGKKLEIPTTIAPPTIPAVMPQLPPVIQQVVANVDGVLRDLGLIPDEVETKANTDTNADQAMNEIMALQGANTASTHTIRVVTQGDSSGGGARGGFIGGFGMAGLSEMSTPGLASSSGFTTNFKLNVGEAQSILTISNAIQSSVLSSWQDLGNKMGAHLQLGLSHWNGVVTKWWDRLMNKGKSPASTDPSISIFEDGKLISKSLAEGIRVGEDTVVRAIGDLNGKVGDAVFHGLPKTVEKSAKSAFELLSIGTSGIRFRFDLSDIFDVFKKQQIQMSAGYLNEFGQFVVYNITDNSKTENRFDGGLIGDPERQAKTVLDILSESRAGRSRLSQMVNGGNA